MLIVNNNTNIVTEWANEPRPSSNILRLIYQGRFLHGNVTLAGIVITVYYYTVFTVNSYALNCDVHNNTLTKYD